MHNSNSICATFRKIVSSDSVEYLVMNNDKGWDRIRRLQRNYSHLGYIYEYAVLARSPYICASKICIWMRIWRNIGAAFIPFVTSPSTGNRVLSNDEVL